MADYYVSASGSDSNSGDFYSPWKTLARVKAAVLSEGVGLKNRILFKRGDTFHGSLQLSRTGITVTDPGWLRFGSYGESDELPVLSGYKILNVADGWVQHDADTWKLAYGGASHGVNYTGTADSALPGLDIDNVGFLKVDGVIHGRAWQALDRLEAQWDYYCDPVTTTLYVRSTAKPTTLASDIRASYGLNGIGGQPSGIEFADLALEGYGNCGVSVRGCERMRVLRCTIREIGGVYGRGVTVFPGSTARVGNGIQAFDNTRNLYCEYNTVHDVYDSGWTIQGSAGPFRDITFRRNLCYRVTQGEDYSFWGTGEFWDNCLSEYNTVMFCGYNWGADERAFTDFFYRGVGQETFQWNLDGVSSGDLTIRRNIYYDMRTAFCHWAYTPYGLKSDYNLILLRPGTFMEDQRTSPPRPSNTQTIEDAVAWTTATGREVNSQFRVLPASDKQVISDADLRASLTELNSRVPMGQVVMIHGPWI